LLLILRQIKQVHIITSYLCDKDPPLGSVRTQMGYATSYSKFCPNIDFTYRSFATTVSQLQRCHNYNGVSTTTVSQLQRCHNYNGVTTTTVSQLQRCLNYNGVSTTTVSQLQRCHNYSGVTTTAVSQLQRCHNYSGVTNQNL
jgi:uncharacterized protein YerC